MRALLGGKAPASASGGKRRWSRWHRRRQGIAAIFEHPRLFNDRQNHNLKNKLN
jgi:hypothetical protein